MSCCPSCAGSSIGAFGTTKESVRAKKNEVNAHAEALDLDVQRCGALSEGERAAWRVFIGQWREFYRADDSGFLGFGTGPLYDQAVAYQTAIAAWQNKVRLTCALSAPDVPKPPEEAGTADVVSAIKFAAVAVVAAAVVYGVSRVV